MSLPIWFLNSKRRYPKGSILHYDANKTPFTERTGGAHTFNHSVLSPQYQLNADGTYTNVGAQPAVDTFAGEKWLRSCGAINQLADSPLGQGAVVATNTLPTGWRKLQTGAVWTVVGAGDGYVDIRFSGTLTGICALYFLSAVIPATVGQVWSVLLDVEILSGSTTNLSLDIRERTALESTKIAVTTGVLFSTRTLTNAATTGVEVYLAVSVVADYDVTLRIKGVNFYQSAYPLPFIPVKTTQPASNSTTTNGCWFSLPDGSEVWQALTGSPMTLATRVRMGVRSGDVVAVQPNILAEKAAGTLLYGGDFSGVKRIVQSSDGITAAYKAATWDRNAVIETFIQVNIAGTKFRVGYLIEPATTITWSHPLEDSSTWAAFDGSFNPSTLYRLMLGYNNSYPMWFNKITVWKRQVSDTELLGAWT